MPTINEDSCARALRSANKGVKEILAHADHAKYFKSMLRDWVQQEKFGQSVDDSDASGSDFGIILG